MRCVILHGGAGRIVDRSVLPEMRDIMSEAREAAWSELSASDSSIAAVAAALAVLEACEYFDAGYGGYIRDEAPKEARRVQLDIALIDGSGRFLSLSGIERVRLPSRLAYRMYLARKSSLAARWTSERAAELDLTPDEHRRYVGWAASHEELIAPFALKAFEFFRDNPGAKPGGTVGCLVRNSKGKLAAGTSTGGTPLAPAGRIGDTPVIGAGAWAFDEIGAFSATGHGESFLAAMPAAFAAGEMRRILRQHPDAFERSPELLKTILGGELSELQRRFGCQGGLCALGPNGGPAYVHDQEMMPVAAKRETADGAIEEFSLIDEKQWPKPGGRRLKQR